MRLADRLARLEAPKGGERRHQRQIEADAADFDRQTEALAARMTPAELIEARWGWTIARQMLRSYPGGGAMFAGMTATDLQL
jgi:hypothetical protein